MGMIYKRGEVWWIKYYKNGKPFRESSGSHKETDAKRLLKKREGEIAEGKLPGVYFDKVRFEELAEDFLTDYRVNGKKTLAKAIRSVRLHLQPVFGGMRATAITTATVKSYISMRQEQKAKNATINRELAALKRMFRLAHQCTPPKVALIPHIPMLSENNVRKGFFEQADFLAFRAALPTEIRGVVTFGYRTGWRLREILGLTWDRVDLSEGLVRLEPGEPKNLEGRTVYLDEELRILFKEQLSARHLGCQHVFHRDGAPIKDFRGAWRRACLEAGIHGKLFHDLRRTAVRNMVRAGVPERVAMAISGHKTRSVFDRYNIVSPDDLKAAANKTYRYLVEQTEREY